MTKTSRNSVALTNEKIDPGDGVQVKEGSVQSGQEEWTNRSKSDDMFGKFFNSMADIARKLPRKQQKKVIRVMTNVMRELQNEALNEEQYQIKKSKIAVNHIWK